MSDMELSSLDGTRKVTLTGLEAVVTSKMVKYMVQRDITCQASGEVLDMRTVIAILNRAGDDVVAVVSPAGWELRKAALIERVPDYLAWQLPKSEG